MAGLIGPQNSCELLQCKKNNWKSVFSYIKGKPLNFDYLGKQQFVVQLVVSDITANC